MSIGIDGQTVAVVASVKGTSVITARNFNEVINVITFTFTIK